MPSRETFAPRTRPMHDMLRRRFLPKGEVIGMFLLVLPVQFAGLGDDIIEVTTGEFAVRIILGIFLHVHIDRTVRHVRVALIEDLLHEGDLLDDMARSVRLDRGRQHVQRRHIAMVAVGIELHHLHRLELLQTGFLSDLILALIRIVLQVTYIRDIPYIAHLITEVLEITIKQIKRDGRTGMPQMRIAVHGRTADIHAYVSFVQGFERFLKSR